jgi:ankyrin repeat protein
LRTKNKDLLEVVHPHELSESMSYELFKLLDCKQKRDCETIRQLVEVQFKTWLFLEAAATTNDVEWMKILLDQAGLDMNDPDGWMTTPITNAAMCDHMEMFDFLLERGADLYTSPCPLHYSANPIVLDKVLAKGIPVDIHADRADETNTVSGMCCFTPLQHAANTGTLEQVKLLLDRGASPTMRASNGYGTALDIARCRKDDAADDIVALLSSSSKRAKAVTHTSSEKSVIVV